MKKILYKVFLSTLFLGLFSFVKERYIYFKYYSNVHTAYYLSNFSKPGEAEYAFKTNNDECDKSNIHKNIIFQGSQYHETKKECLLFKLNNIN